MGKTLTNEMKKRLLRATYPVQTITESRNNRKEYLVYWEGYEEPSWEPRSKLVGDKCTELLNRVDVYEMIKPRQSFFNWQKKQYGADDDNRCVFVAFELAMELINNIGWYKRVYEDEFLKSSGNKSSDRGLSLQQVNGFVHFCNKRVGDNIKQINKKVFSKNYLANCGSGIDVMLSKSWEVGVYFCSAYNNNSIGHCFILQVVESGLQYVHDPNEEEGRIPLLEYGDWVKNWGFVRKIEKLEK